MEEYLVIEKIIKNIWSALQLFELWFLIQILFLSITNSVFSLKVFNLIQFTNFSFSALVKHLLDFIFFDDRFLFLCLFDCSISPFGLLNLLKL